MALKTIQIVLDETLLSQVDEAAARESVNRSAWVREAVAARLHTESRAEREHRHRAGYEQRPVQPSEFESDPSTLVWPDWEEPSQ